MIEDQATKDTAHKDTARRIHVSSIEKRLRAIVDENLEIEDRNAEDPINLNQSIADAGVSSRDVIAFWKLVNEEFNVRISPEQFADLLTPRDLIAYLEDNAS